MKDKQYIISLKNLSVVLTPKNQLWDIVVILNSTKQLWLSMKQVKPNQIPSVVEQLKNADKELSQVYLEMSN